MANGMHQTFSTWRISGDDPNKRVEVVKPILGRYPAAAGRFQYPWGRSRCPLSLCHEDRVTGSVTNTLHQHNFLKDAVKSLQKVPPMVSFSRSTYGSGQLSVVKLAKLAASLAEKFRRGNGIFADSR
jgi:hypothetical protein